MALGKDKLYLISSSYDEQWNEVNAYQSYDLKTGETKTFVDGKDISSPCAIGVDPVTDDVFIKAHFLHFLFGLSSSAIMSALPNKGSRY